MAEIELVIKIPEEEYEFCKKQWDTECLDILMIAVKYGTPLPKGHGRLIDADALRGDFIDGTEGYDCQTWNRSEIGDIIDNAPTVIEEDKESGNEVND